MNHVFLSYCHDDADFVQILKEKLASAGLGTWQDLDLQAGDAWSANIDHAIKSAIAVVVVMSRQSKSSEYVNYEWAFALGSGVPVIPILFKLGSDELHTKLREFHALDFSNFMMRPWDDLTRRLRTIAEASRPFTVRTPRDAPPVVQKAAQSLDSLDPKDRSAAVQTLAQMNHPAARDVLVEAMNHPVEDVRCAAAIALAELRDPRAVPGLMGALRDGKRKDVDFVSYLSGFGESCLPALLAAARNQNEHPGVRRTAVWVLARSPGWPELRDLLHDHDAAVRRAVISSVSGRSHISFQPWMLEFLNDEDPGVRGQAVSTLQTFAAPDVLTALIGALRDSNSEVRRSAVMALGDLQDGRAVPELIHALQTDEDVYLRQYSANALRKLNDPSAVPALLAAVKDADLSVRSSCFAALHGIGGPEAVAGLTAALHDPDPFNRRSAAYSLGEIADRTTVPELIKALNDSDGDVRDSAAYALGRMRDATAVLSLLAALNDPEDDVRKSAADALGEIRDPAAVQGLITVLQCDYEEERIRQAAAKALMSIRTPEARAAAKAWERQLNQH